MKWRKTFEEEFERKRLKETRYYDEGDEMKCGERVAIALAVC